MDDLTRLPGQASSAGTLTSSGAEWGRDLKLGQTVALFGFYASRGDEPLFGRALLD
jgi:hypothetical protein